MSDRDARWSQLLRQANRGDGAAYALFLAEVAPVVRSICAARSGGGEVEDITQEVLLAIHAKRHTWRESEPVSPWLYAIARYKTADAGRAVRRRQGGAGPAVDIDALAEVLPGETGEVTAPADLARLIAGLEGRAARIVRALGLVGDSAAEVGRREGMSAGAVRVAYHRAMVQMRRRAGLTDETPTDKTE